LRSAKPVARGNSEFGEDHVVSAKLSFGRLLDFGLIERESASFTNGQPF